MKKDWKDMVMTLKNDAKKKKVTHKAIAEKTGMLRENVSHVFSCKNSPKLCTFVKIYNAIHSK
jgi:DNA-binding phage protein